MGPKEGGCCAPFAREGELGLRLTQCGLGRGLLPYQVASSFIQQFNHNRHGPKTGRLCPFYWEAVTPSNRTSPGPRFTSIPSGIQPFATVDMAKNWMGLCLFSGGAGSPSNTKLPGPWPTSIPSGILVIQLLGHNGHWPKIGGCAHLGEGS